MTNTSATLENIRRKALEKVYSDRTIEDWFVILYVIYQKHNRTCSPYDLWLQVVNDASQLGETIRREIIRTKFSKEMNVYTQLARLLGRISAFIGRYVYDLQSIKNNDPIGTLMVDQPFDDYIGGPERFEKWLLLKYPDCCPTCGNRPCICAAYRSIMEDRNNKKYDEFWKTHKAQFMELRKRFSASTDGKLSQATKVMYDSSIENWIGMFRGIYASGHIEVSLESVGFHFLEEVGEVSDGLLCLEELHKYKNQIGVYKAGSVELHKIIEEKAGKDEQYEKFWEEYLSQCKGEKGDVSHDKLLKYLLKINMTLIKEELADVFSWMCAILNKIEALSKNWSPDMRPRSLSEALHAHYRLSEGKVGCSYCSDTICADHCIIGSTVRKSRDTRLQKLEHRLFS